MTSSPPKPVSHLESVEPYEHAQPVPLSHPDKASILKLDCNEATYPPSPLVLERLKNFIEKEPLNWYPDPVNRDLKEALAGYTGLTPSSLSVFNGCDHALETLCRVYLKEGDQVAFFSPNYDNFRVFAEAAGATVVPVLGRSAFESNAEGLKKVLSPRVKIVYFSNPTNPTGVTYSKEEIESILRLASSALVIADEAYFEFWGKSSISLIRNYPNLVITRSFSKAFALAGLRCGYIASDPQNIRTVEKIRNGKNVNTLAQVAAIASLQDLSYLHERLREVSHAKKWFVAELQKMRVTVVDTPANFVLIRTNLPKKTKETLEKNGVFIRNRDTLPQLEGYLRITVGRKHDMQRCLAALSALPELAVSDFQEVHLPHVEAPLLSVT